MCGAGIMASLVVYSILQVGVSTYATALPLKVNGHFFLLAGAHYDRLFWRRRWQVQKECLPGIVQSIDDLKLGHWFSCRKHFSLGLLTVHSLTLYDWRSTLHTFQATAHIL